MTNNSTSSKHDILEYLEAIILLVASVSMMFVLYPDLPQIVSCAVLVFLVFILLVFDYQETDESWMSYLFAIVSGLLIGTVQFDLFISFGVLIAMIFRLKKVDSSVQTKLLLLMIVFILPGFVASHPYSFLNTGYLTSIQFVTERHAIQYILIAIISVYVITKQFNIIQESYSELHINQEEYEERILDLAKSTNTLTRFIPNQIWQPIIKDNTPANLFNKRAKLTVFFSDIVGFTELSDNVSADVLTEILNTYMYRMTIVAKRHDAVLDKFIGDGMMCFFGANGHKSVKENALACIAMALDMRREMRVLRKQWQKDGFAGLHVRIGINTGFCHVGNFGTDLRMSYTALGKEVNLAARLESAANADEIYISQATYDYISYEYNCEIVGNMKLKGFESPVTCYRVLEPITSEHKTAQWVDYDLPGFNLHLNFRDVKNYDYQEIRQQLEKAIERVKYIEQTQTEQIEQSR